MHQLKTYSKNADKNKKKFSHTDGKKDNTNQNNLCQIFDIQLLSLHELIDDIATHTRISRLLTIIPIIFLLTQKAKTYTSVVLHGVSFIYTIIIISTSTVLHNLIANLKQ